MKEDDFNRDKNIDEKETVFLCRKKYGCLYELFTKTAELARFVNSDMLNLHGYLSDLDNVLEEFFTDGQYLLKKALEPKEKIELLDSLSSLAFEVNKIKENQELLARDLDAILCCKNKK